MPESKGAALPGPLPGKSAESKIEKIFAADDKHHNVKNYMNYLGGGMFL